MGHGSELNIGERLRDARRRADMTQQQLAEHAGISVDVVRKLEQGVNRTALVGTLQRLARALDVDLATLLYPPKPLPTSADPEHRAGVMAIREALTERLELAEVAAEESLLTVDELRRHVDYCWGAYWHGDHAGLGAVLPGVIRQGRLTLREAPADDHPRVADLLAQIFQVTAFVTSNLGYNDLSTIAVERAIDAAAASNDQLRSMVMLGTFVLIIQRQGRAEEARRLAVRLADRIEPRLSQARPEELSVWGHLLLHGATSAGREGRTEEADELLTVADGAAARLGADRTDYQVPFGPSRVTMMHVDVDLVTGRHNRAVRAARRIPGDAAMPLAVRSRHLVDVAFAQSSLGHGADALATILQVERMAPDWLHHHLFPRIVVGDLLRQERRRNAPLRDLVGRLGLDADLGRDLPIGY